MQQLVSKQRCGDPQAPKKARYANCDPETTYDKKMITNVFVRSLLWSDLIRGFSRSNWNINRPVKANTTSQKWKQLSLHPEMLWKEASATMTWTALAASKWLMTQLRGHGVLPNPSKNPWPLGYRATKLETKIKQSVRSPDTYQLNLNTSSSKQLWDWRKQIVLRHNGLFVHGVQLQGSWLKPRFHKQPPRAWWNKGLSFFVPQRRSPLWHWSFLPDWTRISFGVLHVAIIPEGFWPLPIL